MTMPRVGLIGFLLAAALPAAAPDGAPALLASAVDAFAKNQQNEKHWNWTIVETRRLLDHSGQTLLNFPSVTSESVIRSDGRRCNAVTAWGDGRAPYLKDAGADERCQAFDSMVAPFNLAILLRAAVTRATVLEQSATAIRISILPDSSFHKSPDYALRCASSIKATVALDPATFFPVRVEGDVAASGCDAEFQPVVHYETVTRQPMVNQFRKGASFRLVYDLQKDRFDNPANSFWILREQHYVLPWQGDAWVLSYWGRQVRVTESGGRHLVKDIQTTAREFGAGSQITFDK